MSPCVLDMPGGDAPILVAGKQAATVRQLVAAVEAATNIPSSEFNLLLLEGGTATVLNESDETALDKSLKKDYKIWSGASLVFEKKLEPSLQSSASVVASEYEDAQNRITVRFNMPGSKTYDVELVCDKRDTLAGLKAQMAPLIGFDGVENNDEGKPTIEHFRCRCNARAPVLKKLDETLGGIGLSQGSIVHVEKGAQTGQGQVVVKFYIYDPCPPKGKKAFVAALKMPVDKKATVAEVKKTRDEPQVLHRIRLNGFDFTSRRRASQMWGRYCATTRRWKELWGEGGSSQMRRCLQYVFWNERRR